MEKEDTPITRWIERSRSNGDHSYVKNKYFTDKNFSFMVTDTIRSYSDVAFIFGTLQNPTVENVFALHVLPSGKPLVQHLSMGYYFASYIYIETIKNTASRFNSKEVYFVHNYPLGDIFTREADIDICRKFKKTLGNIAKDGVNINSVGGEYSIFGRYEDEAAIRTQYGFSRMLYVAEFDNQGFYKNIESKQIKNYTDVASIISWQRLNTGNNLSLLILNNQYVIMSNIHLDYSDVNEKKIVEDTILYSINFGGTQVIIYGRSNEFGKTQSFNNKFQVIKKELKDKANVNLIDFINMKGVPDLDLIKRN